MDMTYDTMDKEGNVKTLPLFGDINVRTQRYTFSHPNGLLFATQFAQIALVVTERAAFEDMRAKGLVQKESAFAGHSLGEYSALASIADVLPISSLVDVVFYRGITMQRAVERDSQNRSNYAMCAVNPSRISKTFNDAALREVVDNIASKTGCLLEIVNFNVEVCYHPFLLASLLTFVLGSTIRLCRRARCPSNPDQRSQLPEDREDRHPEGDVIGIPRLCIKLTVSAVDREVHRRPGQGDARRDCQLLLRQGEGAAGEGRLHHPRARLRHHPSPWYRRAFPLSLPVGWCYALPCM